MDWNVGRSEYFFLNSILVIQKWIKFYSIPNKKSGKLESINITFSVSIYTGYLVIDSCRAIFIQMWKHIDGSAVVHILFPRKIIAETLTWCFKHTLFYSTHMEWNEQRYEAQVFDSIFIPLNVVYSQWFNSIIKSI